VITFDPHPRALLHPESAPPLLQTFDQKIEALGVLGIEQTIVIHFDQSFAQIRAEDFLRAVIAERPGTQKRFISAAVLPSVHGREGNIELLRSVSQDLGFFADEVPELRLRGSRVISSRIRQLWQQGQVNPARRMLGRPYGVEGRVVRGEQRGAKIRISDRQSSAAESCNPRTGVYVTAALIDGQWAAAALPISGRVPRSAQTMKVRSRPS